jgi:AraC-like DNA-binding protein
MKYKQLPPPDHLKEYVRHFFTIESTDSGEAPKSFRTIADGCPGLVLQHSGKETFYDQDNYRMPALFVYGQATRHREIYSNEKFSATGIYFHPHALNSIFGFNAAALTDSCIGFDDLAPGNKKFFDQLLNTSSAEEQIVLLSSFLHHQIISRKSAADPATQFALMEILGSNGNASLKNLQQKLGLSERGLERRFSQHVGVSPKLFSRICKFQASLNQLRNNEFHKLSDVAFENEYADQSHFIRVFKEFTGLSPKQYQRQTVRVIENVSI